MEYKLVVKCADCGKTIRTAVLTEEAFIQRCEGAMAHNDRFGDDLYAIGSTTITSYRGYCEECREDICASYDRVADF